jgi:hypothetical protein
MDWHPLVLDLLWIIAIFREFMCFIKHVCLSYLQKDPLSQNQLMFFISIGFPTGVTTSTACTYTISPTQSGNQTAVRFCNFSYKHFLIDLIFGGPSYSTISNSRTITKKA